MSASEELPPEIVRAIEKSEKEEKEKRRKGRASKKKSKPGQAKGEESHAGIVYSKADREKPEFFLKPFIPKRALTLVSGRRNVGKSTFLAWLISRAASVCVMPGQEESVKAMALDRLIANNVSLDKVLWLTDRPYPFPSSAPLVEKAMMAWGAELLIVDPISSFFDRGIAMSDPQNVRTFLEAFHVIAERTGSAVVAVRHPAKHGNNPFPGAEEWQNVPRSLLLLSEDASKGGRFLLTHLRDAFGSNAPPREYRLEGEDGKPKKFIMAGDIDISLGGLASAENDPIERLDIRRAGRYIRHLFETSTGPLVSELRTHCQSHGVGDRARRRAMELLGVDDKPGSAGGKWILIRDRKDWPAWTDLSQN